MSAGRWYVPRGTFLPDAMGTTITLTTAIAHQARNVLRLHVGDPIILFDGSGDSYTLTITSMERDRITATIIDRQRVLTEPRHHLILHQALVKAAKFELIVQKCTEIGVSTFAPLISARSTNGLEDASSHKRQRWEVIATGAAEQSDRGYVPTMLPPRTWAEALTTVQPDHIALLAWEEPTGTTIRTAMGYTLVQDSAADISGPAEPLTVHLFIGPEGGFSTEEVTAATRYGVRCVTLGPRILRAETAAIVATTLVLDALGELGNHGSK